MKPHCFRTSLATAAAFLLPLFARAQEAAQEASAADEGMTWSRIFEYGGTVLWIIVLVSTLTLAYVFWLFYYLRDRSAVPETLSQETLEAIGEGDLDKAATLREDDPSAFAAVARRSIAFVRATPHADPLLVRESVAGEGATQAAALLAMPQRLSHAISIAPMLALLGTVIGMLRSFISIAGDVAAAKPVQLAHGMSQAIVTTIAGLLVAIVASLFQVWFNYRAERLVANLSSSADDLLTALLSRQQKP